MPGKRVGSPKQGTIGTMTYALYIASVAGAAALLLMMPRAGFTPRKLGALLGASTLGGLWLWLARGFAPNEVRGLADNAWAFYYIFSAITIGSAVRVITHTRPVYSALWFIMTVLASSGLFLVLSAEFMAFAMIIIYGGAILVTYVFVIMLAAQAGDATETDAETSPTYDRVAREPFAAVAVGFLLLALLLTVVFDTAKLSPNPAAIGLTDAQLVEGKDAILPGRINNELAARLEAEKPGMSATLAPTDTVDNVERVGVDLFRSHPLGLELAGVILLVSLVGAVIIARKRVEEPAPPVDAGPARNA